MINQNTRGFTNAFLGSNSNEILAVRRNLESKIGKKIQTRIHQGIKNIQFDNKEYKDRINLIILHKE